MVRARVTYAAAERTRSCGLVPTYSFPSGGGRSLRSLAYAPFGAARSRALRTCGPADLFISLRRRALAPLACLRAIRRGAQSRAPGLRPAPDLFISLRRRARAPGLRPGRAERGPRRSRPFFPSPPLGEERLGEEGAHGALWRFVPLYPAESRICRPARAGGAAGLVLGRADPGLGRGRAGVGHDEGESLAALGLRPGVGAEHAVGDDVRVRALAHVELPDPGLDRRR